MAQAADQDHLKLLSIFHYVVSGVAAVFACLPVLHLIIGIAMITAPQHFNDQKGEPPPAMIGWFFAIIGGTLVLLGWAYAVLIFVGGRFLARQKHYTACLVIAALACLFMPFGTILGVFTIVVLMRPSVKSLFDAGPPIPATPPPH